MVPTGLGFVLQNRGALFNLQENYNNAYAPNKSSFHTIIPGFVMKEGKPFISFGVMGGAMQPQGHVQVLVNMIDFGMNLQEACDHPRISHEAASQPTGGKLQDGSVTYTETGISGETILELIRMGHTTIPTIGAFGGYQAIKYDAENDVYYGASESRKDRKASDF